MSESNTTALNRFNSGTSLMAQMVKNLPVMWENQVQSLGWEDTLEKGMATHSSILAWRIHGQGAWWATVHGVTKSWTRLSDCRFHFSRIVKTYPVVLSNMYSLLYIKQTRKETKQNSVCP